MRDFYAILGVERSVSERDLKRAFRQRAKELHPDRNPGDEEAATAFKQVVEAWEVLSDPERRRAYDAGGWRARVREPADWTAAFAHEFRAGFDSAVQIFFERILPSFMDRYQRGRGTLLVHAMLDALTADTFLDGLDERPSFSSREHAARVARSCPVHLEEGAQLGLDDRPVLGRAITVRERGVRWAALLVYPQAFWERGHRDAESIRLELVRVLLREYARHLEYDLERPHRPFESAAQLTLSEAEWVDTVYTWRGVARYLSFGALGAAALWAIYQTGGWLWWWPT